MLAAASIAGLLLTGCGRAEHRPPSFVVILVDDLGAFDLPSYGHPYHASPHIDRLAREGLRFTRAYAASPVCAPTRAALLTGKSPARLRLTHALPPLGRALVAAPAPVRGPAVHPLTEPSSATWLDPAEVTVAECLREHGYVTAQIGKWHLGAGASGPRQQGFDVAIGGEEEAAPPSWFAPYGLPLLDDAPAGEYLTDRLTAEAERFLEENAGRPFLLLLSHFAVHTPLTAPEDRVRHWREELGERTTTAHGGAGPPLMAEYAAMIESVDRSVGRILAKLDEMDLTRDTLVVLTSDNGGLLETPETGQAVTTNRPLRGGKAALYEGGLRVPLLARWPAAIDADRVSEALVSTVDWFPTLLELAGAGAKTGAEERSGRSLVPIFRGDRGGADRELQFHYPHYIPGYRHDPARATYWNTPGAAIVSGTNKLIRRFDGQVELYDLAADPGETRDLSSSRPQDVARLSARLDAWLEAESAHLPAVNEAYDPGAFERALVEALAELGRATDWTPNGGCASAVRDGLLTLDCAGHPFVVGPPIVVRGPLRLELRCRAAGTVGGGAIWYRGPGKPSFDGGRIGLTPCGAELATRAASIAVDGTVHQLRVDFSRPRAGGHVEIDWIRLYRGDAGDSSLLAEWTFDDAGRR